MRLPFFSCFSSSDSSPSRLKGIQFALLLLKGALILTSDPLSAHGLIQNPPSRNWICGAITKPDQVLNGTAAYPICGEAFNVPGLDPNQGYNFMSVLTHDQGLAVSGPRANVCSYDAETWKGTPTAWDQPINWPTTPLSAGPQTFTWNIQWGPHFVDTQEFRYWITKPDFVFKVGTPLKASDLEALPFCTLTYDDQNPNANPNVLPDKGNSLFKTRCTVPNRAGRHVIYGEWGRNAWTYERFHSCIDVQFEVPTGSISPQITLNPDSNGISGSGSLLLDARNTTGGTGPLRYTWSVTGNNNALYHLDQQNQAVTVLHYDSPVSNSEIILTLSVTDGVKTASSTRTLSHRPTSGSNWKDLGLLIQGSPSVQVGDNVSIRAVDTLGLDHYWPQTPLTVLNSVTWAKDLALRLNTSSDPIRIGVLNGQGFDLSGPSAGYHLYAAANSKIQTAYLNDSATSNTSASVRADPRVAQSSPWYGELQVGLSHDKPITALSLDITVLKTSGIRLNGAYNTLGSNIRNSPTEGTNTINYHFELMQGLTLPVGQNPIFAAQFNGSGTIHPPSGDVFVLRYTVDGVEKTVNGTF